MKSVENEMSREDNACLHVFHCLKTTGSLQEGEIEEGLGLVNLCFISQSMPSFFRFQYGGSKWLTLVLQELHELFEKELE